MDFNARTVLIVDGNANDRLTYHRFLTHFPTQEPAYIYRIVEAEHGAQAMAFCQTAKPDCILLVSQLPDMSGLALLKTLVAQAGLQHAAIVMLMGDNEADLARQAVQRGAHDYLGKDEVTVKRLHHTINNAMEKAGLQRALEQQRALLQVMLTNCSDAVIATDCQGRIILLNEVASILTGWLPADANGQPVATLLPIDPEQSCQPIESAVAQVLQLGTMVDLTQPTFLINRDGNTVPIEGRVAPLQGAHGHLLGALLTVRDRRLSLTTTITARRQAEVDGHFWADVTEQIRNATSVPLLLQTVTTQLTTYLAVSDCTFHEVDSDQDQILAVQSDPQPADAARAALPFSTCLGSRLRHVLRTGQTLAIHDTATEPRLPISELQDTLPALRAFVSTPLLREGRWVANLTVCAITPRRWTEREIQLVEMVAERAWLAVEKLRAEAALRSSEERLRLATTAGGIGIFDYDLVNNHTKFSDIYHTITGFPYTTTPTAEAWLARVHPADRPLVIEKLHRARVAGEAYHYQYRILPPTATSPTSAEPFLSTPADAFRWIDVSALVTTDQEGRGVRITGAIRDITARKQTEAQLRYQAYLLENVQDAVISTDTDFRILTWNRGAEQLYGWTAAETRGRLVNELLQTEYFDEQPAAVIEHFRTHGHWQGEVIQHSKNGTFAISNTTVLLYDEQGQPVGAVAVNRDITARKQAEAALRASEAVARQRLQELEAIYNHAPIGLCVLDQDLRWVRINERLAEINGFAAAAHLGRTIRELLPNLADAAEPIFRRILATGEPAVNVELTGVTPAQPGVLRTWVESWFPFHNADGQVVGINVVAEEVTERKRTEAKLRSNEERLRLALEGGRMGIWEWSAATHSNTWSAQEYALFGLPPGTAITTDLFARLIYPDDWAGLKQLLDRAITQGGDYTHEFRIIRPDGAVRWLAEYAIGILDEQGQSFRLLGINFDITERKTQEEALRQLNAELEARVAERTAALEQSNQELARSNRELEQFSYAAAHDLKSPLRGIQHLVQWLNEDAGSLLPAASQKHLALLNSRVQRLEQLLDALLDYSRIGRDHYTAETLDTGALVQDICELLAPPPGFTIEAVTLPILVAPRVPLETILRNLIANAIKHHHQPHVGHVQITAQPLDGWIEFTVRDNGPGIAPEFHERIFGMFQMLQPRDQVEGSGIGLALVKKTVENYGGQIRVESMIGQGATFCFTWPG